MIETVEGALVELRAPLAVAGYNSTNWRVLRIGENAVLRHSDSDLVVRISRSGKDYATVRGDIDFALYLNDHGVPAVPPHYAFPAQPFRLKQGFASFWEYVEHRPAGSSDLRTLGALLSHIHALTDPPNSIKSRRFDPMSRVDARLDAIQHIRPIQPHVGILRARADVMRNVVADLFREEQSLVHGDAHLGNLLVTGAGPKLIDFEEAMVAPQAWDLSSIALSHRRFGMTDYDLSQFSKGYGMVVQDAGVARICADIREITSTTWLGQLANEREDAMEEFKLRVACLSGGSEHVWMPF